MATRDVFVGRDDELRELTAALDDAVSGRGTIVVLAGEPGIGKTRLCEEIASVAVGRGFEVLWGRCPELLGAPAFWPWVQVLRTLVDSRDDVQLSDELRHDVAQLSVLVPELRVRLGVGATEESVGDADVARFRLFAAVVSALERVAVARPVLVLLDDLHRGDTASLLLLEFLSREMTQARILVVGTYRDTEPSHELGRTLGELVRSSAFRAVNIRGLSVGDTASFLRLATGNEPADDLLTAVHSRTEGNPLFITHVARLLGKDPREIPPQDWKTAIPDSIRTAIRRRFERLSTECIDALTLGSLIGRDFSLDQLEAVMATQAGTALVDAVEEALSPRIVEESPGAVGRYVFTHVLIQETLAQGLSAARRARLHARIGAALEELYGPNADAHADELALHYLRGSSLTKAIDFAIKAGDRASATYAWEHAISHFQSAVDLMSEVGTGTREQAEILVKLAVATTSARGRDAAEILERALSLFEAVGDGRKAAEVRVMLSQRVHIFAMGVDAWQRAYSHSQKAVEFLEGQARDSLLARAYARLGDIAAHVGTERMSTAILVEEKGLALAKELRDITAIREAATVLAHVRVFHAGEIERGLQVGEEACEVARKGGDSLGLAEAASYQAFSYAVLMDADEALKWAREAMSASERSGALGHQMLSELALAWASTLCGDTPNALSCLERFNQLSKRRGIEPRALPTPAFGVPGLAYFLAGEWAAAEEELQKLLAAAERMPVMPVLQVLVAGPLGRMLLERGDLLGAGRHLERAVTIASAKGEAHRGFDVTGMFATPDAGTSSPRGEMTLELGVRAILAQVAAKAGKAEEAAAHIRRANEIIANGENWRGLVAETQMAEGVLAAAGNRWGDADSAFGHAEGTFRTFRLPYFRARCLMEWGQMCFSTGRPGDRQKGVKLLDDALVIFQQVQAKKMVEKVAVLKEQAESRPSSASSPPNGLTERQAEVLRLIADGKTNREIAGELVLSQRTVQRHVADIYVKIRARNRAEATAYALKELGSLARLPR